MDDIRVKTLFMYVSSSGIEPVPESWRGMSLIMNNQGRVESAADIINGNKIDVVDIGFDGYNGLPDNLAFEEYQELASRRAFQRIKTASRYDVVVAGQTPAAEGAITRLKSLPSEKSPGMVVRFSSYYGQTQRPYPTSIGAREAGYTFDCSKDHQLLLCLLTDRTVIEAVEQGSEESIFEAVEAFNRDYDDKFPSVIRI